MSPPEADETNAPVTLGDLLGALARDVTTARAHADAEAMRFARIYRGDPLLRTLPVPIFRIADLTISLPVAITGVPPLGGAPAISLTLAASTVLALVREELSRHGASDGTSAADVARAIDARRHRLEDEPEVTREPVAVADALLDAALRALTGVQRTLLEDNASDGGGEQELRLAARARILALAQPPGVQIEATTAAIEAVSPRDSLVQLRVNLSERGVEWAIGEHTERLVPE
jgi:hypothetical protein